MARVKSETMRAAILDAAAAEIAATGYQETTIAQIARRAGTVASNVYSYYGSKLEVYFAIYEPWFRKQFDLLDQRLRKSKGTTEQRLNLLAHAVLHEIARDAQGLTAALAEALATARPGDDYRPDLLSWAEARIETMTREITAGHPLDETRLAAFVKTMMLLFDGIALRSHVTEPPPTELVLRVIVPVLLPPAGAEAPPG